MKKLIVSLIVPTGIMIGCGLAVKVNRQGSTAPASSTSALQTQQTSDPTLLVSKLMNWNQDSTTQKVDLLMSVLSPDFQSELRTQLRTWRDGIIAATEKEGTYKSGVLSALNFTSSTPCNTLQAEQFSALFQNDNGLQTLFAGSLAAGLKNVTEAGSSLSSSSIASKLKLNNLQSQNLDPLVGIVFENFGIGVTGGTQVVENSDGTTTFFWRFNLAGSIRIW